MPRKRQQQQQPVKTIPNQPYGMGEDLTEMQQKVPLPTVGVNNLQTPPANTNATSAGATGGGGVLPPVDVLDQARQFAGPIGTPLGTHSARPGEPVTTGLTTGPGAGQEALHGPSQRRNPRADILDILAADSNDPKLAKMAERARMSR